MLYIIDIQKLCFYFLLKLRNVGDSVLQIDRKKIELAMASKCLNFKELKNLANISNSTITKILENKIPLTPKTLGKIAKALDVKPADLIKDE